MVAMRGCIYSSRACSSKEVVHPVALPNRSTSLRGKWVATRHTNCYFDMCIDLCESSDALLSPSMDMERGLVREG